MADLEKLFFDENFSINKFLSKSTQKSDLETLRTRLKEYGTSLHNSMTEIFKTETESIVDLAENLTNLDSKIQNLIQPASQLREEILTLYNTIKYTRESYDICIKNLEKNQFERHVLNLKQNLLEAKKNIEVLLRTTAEEDSFDNLFKFERVTNNYALQLSFANQLEIMDEQKDSVHTGLIEYVSNVFLQALVAQNSDLVIRCLQMAVNIREQRHVENVYRDKVLSTKLSAIFSQQNLEKQGDNLMSLYEQAIHVLDNDMSFLMNIIRDNRDLNSYRFIRNAFWLEVDKQMTEGLGQVTAPGNPELFQLRFCSTWQFMETIVALCEPADPHATDAAQDDLSARAEAHMKRFNLPVYFEIRYQQITSKFETAFVRTTMPNANIYSDKPDRKYKLYITGCFLDCARLCFSPNVFIPHLADQLIKLTLLLLTRYLSWFPIYTAQFKAAGAGANQMDLVYMLSDLLLVQMFIGREPKLTVYSICVGDLGSLLTELTRANHETIDETIQATVKFIIDLKTDEVVSSLQNVNSIPRLYRKTNRNTPTAPSCYIIEAIEVLDTFQTNFKRKMTPQPENFTDTIISNVATKFILLVSDVLHSVSKTEESLKRLKRQTGNPATDSMQTVDASSDNYKIREQIRLDVGRFVDKFLLICSSDSTRVELNRLGSSAGYVIPDINH